MNEELGSWLARPLAWTLPPEMPSDHDRSQAVRAFAELVAIAALARVLRDPDDVPFAVEAALRASCAMPMALGAWTTVLDTLTAAAPEAVRWPEVPEEVAEICNVLGCAPQPVALLQALASTTGPPTLGVALASLAQAMPHTHSLCWVIDRPDDDAHLGVRRLVGTGHPPLTLVPARDDLTAGTLTFWDGSGEPVAVPRWLAFYDTDARGLRVFAGKHAGTGRPLYRTADGARIELPRLPEDAPAFLQDVGWGTPPPPPRLAEELGQLPADPSSRTHQMASERVAVPLSTPPPAVPDNARLIVRVLTGRYVLRYAPLHVDQPVVIGRNAQFATMVLHHHQISRAHTKVRLDALGSIWVSDMGSTNGSQVNGRDIGADEVRCDAGDVVGAGPLLLRVEYATPEQEERLSLITGLPPSDDRDRLTRLLAPRHLVERLPPAFQASFREGGPLPAEAPSLWGIVLYIDRLTALHAQHGEQVADAAFAVAARVIQYLAPDPLSVVKVAYGEVLVPILGVDEPGARAEAQRLIDALHDHPWEPPIGKLSMTAAIGAKKADESAPTWLGRIRTALKDGRRRKRGAVY